MIKKTLSTLGILLILMSSSSCQQRYKNLEDGLYAEIVTNKGTMLAKLFYKDVPVTVANFVALAEGKHTMVKEEYKGKSFYNGLTFHRVMNNFMIQGGDAAGTGSGDPGYRFGDELRPNLKHDRPGILSMANSGPATNGTQFFITEKPTPWLDGFESNGNLKRCGAPLPNRRGRVACHTIFGELVEGLDIQDSISNVKVGAGSKPVEAVIINEINIIKKGKEAKKFKAAKVFEAELPKIDERMEDAKALGKKMAEEALAIEKAKAKKAQEAFLESNKSLKGRQIKSETGMAMVFTHESNGVKPNSSQRVNINCAGYFENGDLFWTTWKDVAQQNDKYDENQDKQGRYVPFNMPYNETATLIAGFREAMLNMKIGDRARVYIPYYLGYGDQGSPPVIPGKANLVFDIELASIKE